MPDAPMFPPSPSPAESSPGGIVRTRVFPAPRERVFQAFSDPAQLARWWGPQGFTNDFHEFAFRPGGAWRFTMRGPDGMTHAMDNRFTEIVAPERIVLRHSQPAHDFALTMTFALRDSHTGLTWRLRFDDPAEEEKVRHLVIAANEQNFDRLAAHLAASTPQS